MTTIYNRIQNNFTQVSNQALLDTRLSSKAYKLYAYMCYRIGTSSKWEFNKKEILKHFKEGRDAVYDAEKELIDVGFLRRAQKRTGGKFSKIDYEIFAEPLNAGSTPLPENPDTAKPFTANPTYSNKEVINKDNISSGEEKKKKKLSLEEIKDEIKAYFAKNALKSDVEEFLLYYKENIHKTFEKLPYWADKWEKKFIEDVEPKRNPSESSSPTHHVSQDKKEAFDRTRIIMEYCKKNYLNLNPNSLSKEQKEHIINQYNKS